ncbi:MAG: iron-containing alcohol dehydrogenase [Bacteroidales bacterium]|nr:iron-containing alcohol dehydrogenase [Bacteroidales bacterium]
MESFEFYNPVKILFGKEKLQKTGEMIDSGKRILLLYGGGSIKKNGVYDEVKLSLADRVLFEFGGILPNPDYETCMKAVELIKEENLDYILAVGGGSVIDAAKFIAAAARYGGSDPWHILSRGIPVKDALSMGCILTLPATGTEMNSNSVISRQSTTEKFAFSSPFSFPEFSILLPDVAGNLPKKQVANGVVDAYIHVLEQYLTYPVNAQVQDRFAESILNTLLEVGPVVFANPKDYDAMSNFMWAATMALNGLLSCGVPTDWATHTIGHELTALYNIDHARTLAIVLPGLWSVLREKKKDKLLQYAERVLGISEGTDDERAEKAIAQTEEFFNSMEIGTRLSDYGLGEDTADIVADRFDKRRWREMGDRKLVTPAIVRQLLKERV